MNFINKASTTIITSNQNIKINFYKNQFRNSKRLHMTKIYFVTCEQSDSFTVLFFIQQQLKIFALPRIIFKMFLLTKICLFCGDVAKSEIFCQRWQNPRCQEDKKCLSKFEFVFERNEVEESRLCVHFLLSVVNFTNIL